MESGLNPDLLVAARASLRSAFARSARKSSLINNARVVRELSAARPQRVHKDRVNIDDDIAAGGRALYKERSAS